MKGHSAAPGNDFSAFLTGGDLGSKEREHCRDAQRFGERRASTMLNDGTALAARPFHLELGHARKLSGFM